MILTKYNEITFGVNSTITYSFRLFIPRNYATICIYYNK